MHIRDDFDSILETVLKTEFLTLLSEKYISLTNTQLKFAFERTITVTLKKEEFDWRGGNTRTLQFNTAGNVGESPILKPSGKSMSVTIGSGLPSSTRPSHQRLPVSKGGQRQIRAQATYGQKLTSKQPAPERGRTPNKTGSFTRGGRLPSLHSKGAKGKARRDSSNTDYSKAEFMKTPNTGIKKPPPKKRAKPPIASKPKLPMCRALYDYDATDTDELTFREGDLIEIVKKDESGWWSGKFKGKEGLFPNNYVDEC